MENNKYYVPNITEIKVGYRYEYKEKFLDGIVKTYNSRTNV